MAKPERIYLDTSVFGGYFDAEFEVWTKLLFDKIIEGKYRVVYSELTGIELENAPEKVKKLLAELPKDSIEIVENSTNATDLALAYIQEKVVGKTSISDCNHIALATLNNADILVSWNFKHIVNVNRIRGYNAVNTKFGHKILEIRSPKEILEYED
ncbi:MAG: PIN domain-containing protein [Sphingobacteriaceae bacterium]|nr:MAG: PIN domain-containing protein [Sphingobacteriaceae bacterium]